MKINCSFNMISTSGILTQELDPELTSKLPPHHNYTAYLGTVKLREGNILPSIYNLYLSSGWDSLSGYFAFLSLASSYVDWAMSGGARVVPIIIGRDQDYYRKVILVNYIEHSLSYFPIN